MAKITVRDEAHWHELRAQHIGGSDVAALFGLSSFSTRWQLWQEKSGRLPPEDLSDNKAVQAGKFLEQGIAQWAAHLWGWDIHKVEEYHTADDLPGMGATLDYALNTGIPLEIKWNCGFSGDWKYEGDTITEAPEKYILQVQHQMACYDGNPDHAWLVVLINNEPRRMKIPRHDGIIEKIKQEVADFWQSIHTNEEPEPDLEEDTNAIKRLIDTVPLTDVDLAPEDGHLFIRYLDASATEKLAKKAKEAAKNALLLKAKDRMEGSNSSLDRAIIRCGDHKMSITTVAANDGIEVTPDMVGTRINTRSSYKKVTVS